MPTKKLTCQLQLWCEVARGGKRGQPRCVSSARGWSGKAGRWLTGPSVCRAERYPPRSFLSGACDVAWCRETIWQWGSRERLREVEKLFGSGARARHAGLVDGWPDDTDVLRMLYRYKTIGYLVLDSQLSLMPFRFRLFASWTRIPTVERRSGCSSHSIARTKGAICRPTLFTARVTAALDPCHVHVK